MVVQVPEYLCLSQQEGLIVRRYPDILLDAGIFIKKTVAGKVCPSEPSLTSCFCRKVFIHGTRAEMIR